MTYGEIFAVQPFANSLVTMTLTGAQIERVLEQQADLRRPGSRPSSILLNGTPISPVASYRVTVNSFLADGGDGFSVLREGTNRLGGDVDTDAFSAYLEAHSPIAPTPRDRITRLP